MTDRVALYARISEDELGLEAGVSRQLEDLRELARTRGWDVVTELSDNDISATKAAADSGGRRNTLTDWGVLWQDVDDPDCLGRWSGSSGG